MRFDPNMKQPPAQGGCSYPKIDFPSHVRQRMKERGGQQAQIQERIRTTLRDHQDLRGAYALTAQSPIIIANFRQRRVIVTTLLELGMVLKPGTRTMQV